MNIHWKTGTPPLPDLYLVAIKLGDHADYCAFVPWNGQSWDQSYPENVIAWHRAGDLIGLMDLNWPEPDFEAPDDLGKIERGIDQYVE